MEGEGWSCTNIALITTNIVCRCCRGQKEREKLNKREKEGERERERERNERKGDRKKKQE